MTRAQRVTLIGLAAILAALIASIIIFVGNKNDLSSQENVMFNVLLTVFSVFISIIISHFYFEASRSQSINEIKQEYQSNLTLYAQKAAEKVDNLSNELSKLSVYLDQEEDVDLNPYMLLLIRKEKIRGAIHIIETLKSVNDKSLSDWRGVIPEEEIDEKNEARAERELEFMQVVDTYKQLLHEPSSINIINESGQQVDIHNEIGDLSKKIDTLATSIIGTPLNNSIKKTNVQSACPNCGEIIKYRQKPSTSSKKRLNCPACSTKLMSNWSDNVFELVVYRKNEQRKILSVSEDDIERVKGVLPAQPWPTGISHQIAEELGLTNNQVRKAISALIHRGIFHRQVDGVVYNTPEFKSVPPSSDIEA